MQENKSKFHWLVLLGAIAALTAIEITALNNGIDGTLLLAITAIIAGIAGLKFEEHKVKKLLFGIKKRW